MSIGQFGNVPMFQYFVKILNLFEVEILLLLV